MKIKVESEKIIKAVQKLDGIDIVVENADDAKEAINLILRKTGIFDSNHSEKLRGIKVSAYQKYEDSAVIYKMIFLLEFLFEEDESLDSRVTTIKRLQDFFDKV